MEQNYKNLVNKSIYYVLLLYFMMVSSVFAQTEVEPNNEANQTGTQRVWNGPTTISGTVTNTDPDYWNVSKLPGFDPQRIIHLFFSNGYDTSKMKIEYEVRSGSYSGTVVSPFRDLVLLTSSFPEYPSAQIGWYYLNNFGLDTADNYVVFRITTASVTPVNYSLTLQSEDFPTCTTPADVTGLNVTTTGGDSLQFDAFSAVNGITGGYVIEISDSPTFTPLPSPQFDKLTDTTPSTVYSGSGQQVIYASPKPNRLISGFEVPTVPGNLSITGLAPNVTYYFRVTTANECNGNFSFGNGVTVSGATFACDPALITPNQVSNIATVNNTIDSFGITSFTAPNGGANGYVIKVNTTNSFTAPTDADLTSASTTYNAGAGEQVVYAGTSINPNITINGTGITAGANFFVKIYAYNTCLGGNFFENIGTTRTQAICNGAPTVVPSALSIDQISHSSMRVNSTSGAGGAIGQVILINTVDSFTPPIPGALPTANTVYSGTGQQVIYRGSDVNPAVTVSNLTNSNGGTQYFFKSYAYNPCGSNFYFEATGVKANATTCGAVQNVASNAVFFEVGNSFMDFKSFSPAAGVTGYVVKMNTVNTFSAPIDGSNTLPVSNTNYTGGEQIIYAGTSTNPDIRITGLSAATTYYFTIYSYTDCNGSLFYEQTGYSFSRQNVNTPSNLTFNDFSVTFGAAAFDLNNLTSSLSPGARSYTIIPGGTSTGGNALSGTGNNIMTAGNVGTVLVRVDQEAAANFNSGTAQATITINKANPTITFNNQTVPFGSSAVTLGATSNSTGTISYSFVGSANGNVLSGTNNEILTPGNAGTVTVRATVAADANFNEATKDIFFSVSAPSEIISINANGVYKVVNESTISTLVDFTANAIATGSDGKGELLQASGKLWGVTNAGGANGKGTIFNLNIDGTGFTKVHDFNATTEGSDPSGFLTFSNGKIWGVLSTGGPGSGSGSAGGSIFSINTDGTNFTVVRGFSFTDFTLSELAAPIGGLTEANGKLWGVTQFGGHTFAGGVYSINSDGTGYTEVYLFPSSGSPGQPRVKLTLANNKLWGTASSNGGGIFTIDPTTIIQAGTGYSLVHRFGFSGGESLSTLTTVGNQLFGVWREGGANNAGVLFRINDNGTNYTTLYDWPFSGGARLPFSSLTIDGGTLFGSTTTGGTNNFGTIYKIKTDGTGYQEILANTVTPSEGAFIIVKDRLIPTINFNNQTVDHLSVSTLSATTNSTSSVTYALIGDTTASALNGNEFTAGNAGTVTVRASIAQDENFEAATKDAIITINKTNPSFTIADISTTFGSPDITLAPNATNYKGGSVTYQFVDPTNTNNLATTGFNTSSTISGEILALGTLGTETIRATLAGTSNFNTATFDFQLNIGNGIADLSGFTDFAVTLLQSDVTLSVSSAPGVAVNYQLLTSNTGTSLSGTNNEVLSIGSTSGTETIRVTVTEPNYVAASKDITLTVNKVNPIITWGTPADVEVASVLDGTQLNAMADVPGSFKYYFDASLLNEITSGVSAVTTLGANTIYCQFTPDNQTTYNTRIANVTFNVTPTILEITADDITIQVGEAEPTLTYKITKGQIAPGELIFVPLIRASGTTVGDYAITIDATALPNPNPTDLFGSGFPACSGGTCIYTSQAFGGGIFNGQGRTGNYTIQFIPGTLSIINKTPITASDITFNAPANLIYDGTSKSYTATPNVSLSPALSAGDIDITYEGRNGTTYASSTTAPTNAGDYTVIASVKGTNADYTGNVRTDFTIGKKTIEVTADTKSKIYGDSDSVLTYRITNGSLVGSDTFTGALTRVSGETVGTYTINQGTLALNSNYTLSFVSSNLTIGKRAIEITADAKSKIYGGSDPALTYQITNGSLVGSDAFTGSLTRVSGETVGTYTINQGTLALNSNYTLSFVSSNLTIGKRAIEITADAKSKIYGDSDPALTYQITNGSLVGSDAFTGVLTRVSGETVGTYAINQGTLALNSNYTLSFVSSNLTIGKRAIEITADAKSKIYGDSDPALTYQITNGSLVGSDSFTGSLTRVSGEIVGTYAINQGTLALNNNYTLSFVSNNLTIGKRAIEITADAKSKVYGDSDPALTYQITNGSLVGSDAFTGSLTRVTGETVGTYAINQGTLALNSNYTLSFVSNNLTIGKRVIEITSDAKSKVYGDSDPVLTYQITNGSLVGSDAFTGILTRVSGETAGTYAINQGTLALNGNYTLSFVSNNLTIGKRAIEITADAKSKVYGDSDPALTYQITNGSLVGSDAFTGSLTRVSGETVGTYAINQGTLALNSNYTLSFVSNNLTIGKRVIEITADAKSKIYGDSDPALTYQITNGSLIGSDSFTGALTRASGEIVGTYAINQGTLALNSNYTLSFVSSNLTIGKRAIEITADAKSKVYGDSDPALTYQITNGSLVGSDTFTGALSRNTGENVGNYSVNQGSLMLGNNYTLSFVSNDLTITKKAIEVTVNANQSKVFGTANPTYTYSITNGNLVGSDVFTGALTRNTGENVGVYPIAQGSLALGANYDLSFVADNFTITKATASIVINNLTQTYDGTAKPVSSTTTPNGLSVNYTYNGGTTAPTNAGSYTVIGTINEVNYQGTATETLTINKVNQAITFGSLANVTYGDADFNLTASSDAGLNVSYTSSNTSVATISGSTVTIVGAGTTTITAVQGGNTNYNAAANVTQTLTVGKKVIEITADAKTKVYGDSDPTLTYQITNGSLVGSDAFTGGLARATGEAQGNYGINQGTLVLNNNYDVTFVGANFYIDFRFIRVVPTAAIQKVYGDSDPSKLSFPFAITQGSLAFDDAIEVFGRFRDGGENVGNYQIRSLTSLITSTNGGQSSYSITYTNAGSARLLINPRAIEVTADAKSKEYGSSDPSLTYQITNGALQFSDAFTGTLERVSGEALGSYAINQGTLVLNNNYTLSFVGNNLTIGKRLIEVTADAKSKVYGDSDPALTYQITNGSLVGSDAFTGTLTRVSGETVGTYVINQGTLALNNNYTLSFVNNTLSITPALNQVIWDGSTNTTWIEGTNWSGNTAPTSTQNALIPNVVNTPMVGIAVQVNDLTVESLSSFDINENGSIRIEGNLENSGNFTMTSTTAKSSTLIVKGTSNGQVTYERGGLKANVWSIVSAPVSGQSIKEFVENAANDIRINTSVTPNRYAVGYYDDNRPAGNKWVYYTADDLASNSIVFEKGKSYAISRGTNGSVRFTGTIETGDVNKPVAVSEWNAVGNPYTAFLPINENSGVNLINENSASFDPSYVGVYVWDNAQSKYIAKTLVSGESSLAPGQGFFVKTTNSGNNIVFKQAQRMLQPVTGGTFNKGAVVPTIQLSIASKGVKVNTNISYRENATEGLDVGYDVGNFDGSKLDIYTRLIDNSSEKNFTYQSLPSDSKETSIVPVGIKAKEGALITISGKGISLPIGVEMYLEDRALGKFVNLNIEDYTLTITGTNDIGRFYLHTKAQVEIPEVTLADIKLYNVNNKLFVEGVQGDSFEVAMYNTAGMLVYKNSFEGIGKNSIDLPSVEAGVYIVRINTNVGIKSKKIILKKIK